MRILITGSRDWDDEDEIVEAINYAIVTSNVLHNGQVTVVHGACPDGADAIADRVAREGDCVVERHPAQWDKHPGKSAGYVRNAEMVELGADMCLAFIKNNSPGATMTAQLADDAGIPVKVYRA